MKLKRIITFTKRLRKKLKFKTTRIKLENITTSIWIEWWNWNNKCKGKKLEIQKMRTKLKNIFFGELGFNDKIENK